MRNNIALITILIILGIALNIFINSNSSKEITEITETPDIGSSDEIEETDTSSIDFKTGNEWIPVPVISCEINTSKDKNWITTKYIVTLENGVVIGSDKKIKIGSREFCWMNTWYQMEEENMDSLVFKDPYIDKRK